MCLEKTEQKAINRIKNILKTTKEVNEKVIEEVRKNIKLIRYSNILSQKIILKILLNQNMNENTRKTIIDIIIKQYPKEEIINYIAFLKTMLKIEKRYLFCIREQISKEFDSFFVFLATLGMYTCENLEIIELPKKTMIDQAKKVLRNDVAENISQSKIVIGYDTYIRKRVVIDNIYRIAIKYGCILEKFDDISFNREEVVSVNLNTIPFFELKITDWSLERRQIFSSSYYSTRARKNGYKRSYENDIIYNYYKCYICKKMTILNVDSEVEYFIQSMLERQFAGENMFQLLVRYASLPDYKLADLASYSYSVYLLLYIELLILLFVDKKIYKICNLKDIKKNMFGANIISDEEFEQTIKICFPEEQGKSLKTEFYKIENGIVLGCWMFNSDLLIIEKVNDLVFNIKQNVMLGKDVDTFGKKILEKIVKEIANKNDWKTVKSNIQIKSTDFDLIAFKDGNVILGQVKASHTTRKPYSLWKANEVILDANRQILRCKKAIEEDKYLLYSNLKREKIVSRREEIKNVIFIVICGNSYLNGNGEIPVVGIEDWNNLLKIDAGKPEFYKFLECPSMMYKLDDIPEYKESIIETEEYVLLYNELE